MAHEFRHTHARAHTNTMRVYTRAYIHMQCTRHTHMHTRTNLHAHTQTQTYTRTPQKHKMHTHQACTYTYIHTYTCSVHDICTHRQVWMHIHKHTPPHPHQVLSVCMLLLQPMHYTFNSFTSSTKEGNSLKSLGVVY